MSELVREGCLRRSMRYRDEVAHNVQLSASVMHGHVPPFAGVESVGEELVHEVGELEASVLEDACFAVLGEDYVRGVEGGR